MDNGRNNIGVGNGTYDVSAGNVRNEISFCLTKTAETQGFPPFHFESKKSVGGQICM